MVCIRFSHFVLSVIVITLLCLRNCDAYSTRGVKNVAEEAGDTIMMSENDQYMNTKKEIVVHAIPEAAEEGSDELGGRKFMMDRRQLRKEVKRDEGISKVNEEASRNSGTKIHAEDLEKPTASSEQTKDDQYDRSQLSTAEPTRGSKRSPSGLKNSLTEKSDDHGSFQKLESEKLLEAETQIVNLMNKDYPGGGGGRHKPPINNREPLH